MLYLVDECLPRGLARALSGRDHDVVWAGDVCPGKDDEYVLDLANVEGRIVITSDRGFGDMVIWQQRQAVGLIVLLADRLPGDFDELLEWAARQIDELAAGAAGQLTILEPGRVRQRPLPGQTP